MKRIILLCIGLSIMAFGIAFSIKAQLGTSPISSVPYVTSIISGLSVGTTTIIVNSAFILAQIIILRKKYELFQLLQFPGVMLFGFMIDVAESALSGITVSNYFQQWVLCIIGILLVAFGVSMEVTAKLITTPGEGLVIAVCKVAPVKFSNMKVIFDLSMVIISVALSFIFLGKLDGVREGTVAAAIFVGLITKQTNKLMKTFEKYL